jgi:hypothetical protein
MPLAADPASLPPLGWQAPAARHALAALLAAPAWLRVSGGCVWDAVFSYTQRMAGIQRQPAGAAG